MRTFFAALLVCMAASTATASHIVGGDMHYEYLGNDQYLIVLKVYRDCATSTTNFDDPLSIGIYNASNVLVQNVEIPLAEAQITDLPIDTGDPCLQAPTGLCVKEAIYTATVTLPPSPGGYTLAYQRCCRNVTLVNTESNDDIGVTFTTTIPGPEVVEVNSNPAFIQFPPVVICLNEPFVFDHSATDLDGDSLVYVMCNPLLTNVPGFYINPPGAPDYPLLEFIPGYSYTYPIDSDPAFAIDPETGILTGTPTQFGQYVVGICVEEYRDGVLINTTNRDFQFNIVACGQSMLAAIDPPAPCEGLSVSFGNNSQNGTTYAWDFGVNASEADTSSVEEPTFTYPAEGVYTVTLIVNPGYQCADTATISYGVYAPFSITAAMNSEACVDYNYEYGFDVSGNFPGPTVITWTFENGSPATATGTNVGGITFSGGSTYTVTAIGTNGDCTATSSLEVTPPILPFADISPQTVFCEGLTLDFSIDATNADAFQWDFGEPGSSDQATGEDVTWTYDAYGTYTVTVIADPGSSCEGMSTATVQVFPPDPITGDWAVTEPNICDTVPRVQVAWSGNGQTSLEWQFGDGDGSGEITDEHIYGAPGIYTVSLVVYNEVCDTEETFSQDIQVGYGPVHAEVLMPNVFTPNDDGRNERFRPFYRNEAAVLPVNRTIFDYFSHYRLRIYNRWGGLVYDSATDGVSWDGVANDPALESTYYYIVEYQRACLDTDIIRKEGHLELLRK